MALPNWAQGAASWARGNRTQAFFLVFALLAVGVVALLFSGGARQDSDEQQQAAEDDLFGAGALPSDVTTASAISQIQVTLEDLRFAIDEQQKAHALLAREFQTESQQLRSRLDSQQESYEDELAAALEQAMEMARETERRDIEQTQAPAPPPRLRILRAPDKGEDPASAGRPAAAQASAPAGRPGGPWVRLPVGSLVTGELLTGAFATQRSGDALPVLVKLRTVYSGPNETEVPLEGCLMVGKATADLQAVRARVEAVSLSCVLPDGTSFERRVRGYFTGDDGTLGVPGRWQFRSGRWLANLLSAMGTAAGGIAADVAIARELGAVGTLLGDFGASEVTQRIQEFFLERAEEIMPVIWVESGTPIYAVMLEGLTIEGLPADARWPAVASEFD